jgi:hypothetical protein
LPRLLILTPQPASHHLLTSFWQHLPHRYDHCVLPGP